MAESLDNQLRAQIEIFRRVGQVPPDYMRGLIHLLNKTAEELERLYEVEARLEGLDK